MIVHFDPNAVQTQKKRFFLYNKTALEDSPAAPKSPAELQRDLERFLACLKRAPGSDAARGEAMSLAYSLEEAGKLEQAVKILRCALAADPKSGALRRELIKLFERAGQADRAVELLLSGGEAAPEACLEIAAYLITKGQFDGAEAVMRRRGDEDWSGFEAAATWGRIRRWQHRFDEAAVAYEHALRARPDALEVHLWLAETHLHRGKMDEMFAALRRARRDCPEPAPGDLPGLLRRFRLMICLLDYEAAFALGERALDLTRRGEDLEWLQFQIFTEEFDFTPRPSAYVAQALAALDALVARKPRKPWAFYFRSMMAELSKDREETRLEDLRRLRRFSSERYGFMRYVSGLGLFHEGLFEEAVVDFEIAARACEPGHWKSQGFLCESLILLRDAAGAERALAALEPMAPPREAAGSDYGECLAVKGKLLLWLGRYAEALESLEKSLSHTSYDAECWKGACLLKLGRPAEALAVLDRAVTHQFTPTFEEARLWRCEALLRLGRHPEALRACAAAEEDPRRSFFWSVLEALAKAAAGDRGALRPAFQALPPPVAAHALRAAGARAATEATLAPVLEKVLELAGGRRSSHRDQMAFCFPSAA